MDQLHDLPIPLLTWYRENARVLPWRSDPTPYHVWVSEIMLQQTRVAAVLDYYRRFLEAAPDVSALAALPQDQLMKLWQGLGYYSRARNLQKAAKQIMERHGGIFPNTYEDIRALAGVGDYTAGAVAAIAFGLPVPAVDGNVLRVAARIAGDSGDITTSSMKKKVTKALEAVIPLEAPGDFAQALMELGATVCLPNLPPTSAGPSRRGARRSCPSSRPRRPAGWRSARSTSSSTETGWPSAAARGRDCWPACGSTPTSRPAASAGPPSGDWPSQLGSGQGRGPTSSPISSGA